MIQQISLRNDLIFRKHVDSTNELYHMRLSSPVCFPVDYHRNRRLIDKQVKKVYKIASKKVLNPFVTQMEIEAPLVAKSTYRMRRNVTFQVFYSKLERVTCSFITKPSPCPKILTRAEF